MESLLDPELDATGIGGSSKGFGSAKGSSSTVPVSDVPWTDKLGVGLSRAGFGTGGKGGPSDPKRLTNDADGVVLGVGSEDKDK